MSEKPRMKTSKEFKLSTKHAGMISSLRFPDRGNGVAMATFMNQVFEEESKFKESIIRMYIPDGIDPVEFLENSDPQMIVQYNGGTHGETEREVMMLRGMQVGHFTKDVQFSIKDGLIAIFAFQSYIKPDEIPLAFPAQSVMEICGLELRMTCHSCPEQYDVFKGEHQVAYLRVRHGRFEATCLNEIGVVVYSTCEIEGDGSFTDGERFEELVKACNAINRFVDRKVGV